MQTMEKNTGESTKILGEKIRALRDRRGMTQAELAEKVGITPQDLSKLENNRVPGVEFKTVIQIAQALGIRIGLLADAEVTVEAIQTLDIVEQALQKGQDEKQKNKGSKTPSK